jgi:hypothetical protein
MHQIDEASKCREIEWRRDITSEPKHSLIRA